MKASPPPLPLFGVGMDLAAHSGIAVVAAAPRAGERSRLIGLWAVYGDALPLWWRRAQLAVNELVTLIDNAPFVAWAEDVPRVAIRGAFGGDKMGMKTAGGIGKRIGRVESCWMASWDRRGVARPQTIDLREQPDWTAVLGRRLVSTGKVGDGSNRIAEAGFIVEGARERLERMPESCKVDCAEAILIAEAALRHGRGLCAVDELPSQRRKAMSARRSAARRAS